MNSLPQVGEQTNRPYKIDDAGINDNDLGKAVKFSAANTVALCGDGDEIYGFINSIEEGTEDGKTVVGVTVSGRARVTLDGDVALGAVVEAGAQTAAGTAKAGNWANVSVHTPAATDNKRWMLVAGAGTDGTDGVVELQ